MYNFVVYITYCVYCDYMFTMEETDVRKIVRCFEIKAQQ